VLPPDLDSLDARVLAFVAACNFVKHLKRPRWPTPFQAGRDAWAREAAPFKVEPRHFIRGPHT
jgi:hypothetical protein